MRRLAVALLLAGASPVAAQVVPTAGDARAEYFTFVARQADRFRRELGAALAAGDSARLAARFGADVVWTPSTGSSVRGAGAVARAFLQARARVQGFRVELAELDASNRLAFVTGRFVYDVPTTGGLLSPQSRPFAAALYQEREEDWKVRLLTGGDLPPALAVTQPLPQAAVVGTEVPFAILVRDGAGAPLPRSVIRFDVVAGGGRVSPSELVTDEAGRAATTFTLGGTAGLQRLRVLAGALPDEPLEADVAARPAAAASVALTTETTARVVAGDRWPAPIEVRVRDAFGNDVPDAEIRLAVTGAGTLEAVSLRTDASGRARTALATTDAPGEILVEARHGEASAELALRTHPGPAASIDLPAAGLELLERASRETGLRLLDRAGRPTDVPTAVLRSRDPAVATVTDDARVVGVAAGQTWVTATAGPVQDSLWVTVRSAEGSAVQSAARVVRVRRDTVLSLPIDLVPPSDSLGVTGLAAEIRLDTATVQLLGATSPVPGLVLTPNAGRTAITVTLAPARGRRPAPVLRGPVRLAVLELRIPAAARDGAVFVEVQRLDGPPRGAAPPVPPRFAIPILISR